MSRELRLDEYLPYRLSVASNAVSRLISRAYDRRFGLAIPQWRLVCVLAESEGTGLTQAEIVGRTEMDKVTVSRAAQVLLKRKLVARRDNKDDGRSHVLSLTDQGQALYGEIAPVALGYEQTLLAGLDEAGIAALKAILVRLQARAAELEQASDD